MMPLVFYFFFQSTVPHRNLHSFPTRRSSDLKFGIYSSPGPETCAGFTGSYQHEQQDAQTYAEWGVDYLKRSEEHTSELQSRFDLVCRLLLEKKKKIKNIKKKRHINKYTIVSV